MTALTRPFLGEPVLVRDLVVFAQDAIGTNMFARFFSGTSHARPFYYYAYQLPLDFLPWTLLLPAAVVALARRAKAAASATSGAQAPRAGISDGSTARFLVSWILVPLAFFSLSAGKRGLYLLPIYPALALACTLGVPRRVRALVGAIGAVALLELAGAFFILPRLDAEKSPRPIARAYGSSRILLALKRWPARGSYGPWTRYP